MMSLVLQFGIDPSRLLAAWIGGLILMLLLGALLLFLAERKGRRRK